MRGETAKNLHFGEQSIHILYNDTPYTVILYIYNFNTVPIGNLKDIFFFLFIYFLFSILSYSVKRIRMVTIKRVFDLSVF